VAKNSKSYWIVLKLTNEITVTDDVTNEVTHRIFNTKVIVLYGASFILKLYSRI